MRIQYLGAVAIASLLTLSTVACGNKGAVNPAEVSQETADPGAVANPCAAANPGAGAKAGAQPEVYAFEGVAIRGADPVAYFTAGKAVKGSADYETTWNGATWRFSSAENLAAFEADPIAYAPQYGGYCAWAVKSGYLASVDPEAWKIVDGKLYLNYSPGVQRQWQADIAGNITQGDQNWPAALGSSEVSESGKSW
ncbi:YHS domain-containing (seleno)protein [Leptolyngbya sp. CCNP1308]|uniref:YHS domain-containing (seleno)protein n=1 Tax=Leptolyngbya sp. CCNP1308 TaxID=3110255 RepID=UPI002B220682|nr:YHS domain-containing (seleno)protein [Leptolyngbya sp. CCNP1308]MEA5449024.1 YHS domain-containing (seleno)protein [Leptolyngbya sp. CCNP1308]